MAFMKVNGNTTFSADGLKLTSDSGYSVAVYVPALDEPTNSLYYAELGIYFKEQASALGLTMIALLASVQAALF